MSTLLPLSKSRRIFLAIRSATISSNFIYNISIVKIPLDVTLPVFSGHLYSFNTTDIDIGTRSTSRDPITGNIVLSITIEPQTIQFWVEE